MKIALLGSIPKGDDMRKDWVDWKVEYTKVIQAAVPSAEFIHGDSISDTAGAEMVVGHDLAQIKRADLCVIDARTKIGAGTAQEMVIAKHLNKPVVVVMPKNTHHRKNDVMFHGKLMPEWIHPFLKLSADYVAGSIEDAATWIKDYAKTPTAYKIKDMSIYEKAIKLFEESER